MAGKFMDLRNRFLYAIPLLAMMLLCLAFVPSSMVFIGLFVVLALLELVPSFWYGQRWHHEGSLALIGLFILVAVGLATAVSLRLQGNGFWILFMVIGCAVCVDAGAYFGGKLYGKKTDSFNTISPNKTWAGVKAGYMAGYLWVLFVLFALRATRILVIPGWAAMLLFPVLPLAAVAGDLYESWTKRQLGIKDFTIGHNSKPLLGSHGGVIDRLDSIAAVFVAFVVIQWLAT